MSNLFLLSKMVFQEQMAKIADVFGESQKDKFENKMREYYDAIAPKLDDNSFIRACDIIRENNDKFPTIKTILELGRGYRPMYDPKKNECTLCDGFGCITAWDTDKCRYSFACPHCKSCPYKYPMWGWQSGFSLTQE